MDTYKAIAIRLIEPGQHTPAPPPQPEHPGPPAPPPPPPGHPRNTPARQP